MQTQPTETSSNELKWASFYDRIKQEPDEAQIIEFIMDGGRSGGKTHHIATEIVECVSTRENFSVIASRANATDLSASVRAIIIKKIDAAGLRWAYKIPESELTITNKVNGNKIYFRAYEKAITRTKGNEPEGRIGILWVDEANEGRSPDKLDAMMTTFYRHMEKGARVFYTYNPMPNPQHWSHEYFAKMKLGKNSVYLWCNWMHVAKFLPKAALQKIIDAKHANEKYYRFWYQGEMISFDGLIFPQWKKERHYVTPDHFKQAIRSGNIPRLLLFAVDGGTKRDMTAVAPLAYMRNHQLVMLDKYYHNPIRTMPLAPSRQSKYINDFVNNVIGAYPDLKHVKKAFVFDSDSGSQEIMLQLNAMFGYTVEAVAKKEVWPDIHKFQDLLDEDLFYAINNNGYKDYYTNQRLENDPFIDEIENYSYDPETNDIKKNQTEHLLKAIIYGVKSLYSDPRVRTLNQDFLTKIGYLQNNFKY